MAGEKGLASEKAAVAMQHAAEPAIEKVKEDSHSDSSGSDSDNLDLVGFDGPDDKQNPRNWSKSYKWALVFLLSGMSLTTNLTVLVCAPATPDILAEFHSVNSTYSALIVSIWNLGATLGCLIYGPLSEIYGRRHVYNIANLLFLLMLVAETQSKNIAMVLAFRCLNGFTIATTALNPSIVGDLFRVEERGRAQSILSLMPLLGPAIGPIIGGWISEAKGWRWSFWFAAFVLAAFGLCFALLYRETYEATILRRKAERLRKETGNPQLHSRYDHKLSTVGVMGKAFIRPIKIFRIPIFLILTTSMCILSGYVYVIAASITSVFESTYGFSSGSAGLAFLGLAIGMASGALLCSVVLDKYTKHMKAKHGEIKPEWRLPPMTLGFIISPIGLIIYGWAAEKHVHWIVPIIGTALCGFASYTITIPVITYLSDTFGIYRASAMSAMTMYRNAASAVLPLTAPALYGRLGVGWGNSVLAFIALAFVPVPWILLKYGERIRRSSHLETWS